MRVSLKTVRYMAAQGDRESVSVLAEVRDLLNRFPYARFKHVVVKGARFELIGIEWAGWKPHPSNPRDCGVRDHYVKAVK